MPAPLRQRIQRYGAGSFVIAGKEYSGSLCVAAGQIQGWEVAAFEEITENALACALREPVEILVIGSGAAQAFFPPALRETLRRRGVAVECMDTGAACRTFNILLEEGRQVAALLIAV